MGNIDWWFILLPSFTWNINIEWFARVQPKRVTCVLLKDFEPLLQNPESITPLVDNSSSSNSRIRTASSKARDSAGTMKQRLTASTLLAHVDATNPPVEQPIQSPPIDENLPHLCDQTIKIDLSNVLSMWTLNIAATATLMDCPLLPGIEKLLSYQPIQAKRTRFAHK